MRWESQAEPNAKHADEKPHFNVKLIIIYAVKKVHSRYIGYNRGKKNRKKKEKKGLVIVFSQSLFTMVNVTNYRKTCRFLKYLCVHRDCKLRLFDLVVQVPTFLHSVYLAL